MDSIPDILKDLRAGRTIVLVDDEQRENEGDLVCAAERVTPETINFMLREGRGMLCVALANNICERLDLHPPAGANTSLHGTAYTISVDAQPSLGIQTGVSATDRATTIRVLIDENSRPTDLARPGHVQPLRARPGGTLVRAGQTEGSIDLCRLAGLKPGAAIIEVMNEDGSMARRKDLLPLCNQHSLKMCSVADIIQYRLEREKLVDRIDTRQFENDFGHFTLIAYRSMVDPFPHLALVCGQIGHVNALGKSIETTNPVLVRMHSQNLLGDVFGDLTQPSGKTLQAAMRLIQNDQQGALVYLRHDRLGTGLVKQLQTSLNTLEDLSHDLPDRIHEDLDDQNAVTKGSYGIGAQILRDLGIRQLRLITNHPFTPTALSGFGLSICEFVPVQE